MRALPQADAGARCKSASLVAMKRQRAPQHTPSHAPAVPVRLVTTTITITTTTTTPAITSTCHRPCLLLSRPASWHCCGLLQRQGGWTWLASCCRHWTSSSSCRCGLGVQGVGGCSVGGGGGGMCWVAATVCHCSQGMRQALHEALLSNLSSSNCGHGQGFTPSQTRS
jgi:hypothetical protein